MIRKRERERERERDVRMPRFSFLFFSRQRGC